DQAHTNYVVVDDKGGAFKAVNHLIENGHVKINGIFKIDDMQGHERFNGFTSAIYKAGLSFDENSVIWYSTENLQDIFSPDNAPVLVEKLGGCTAVACYNDEIAALLIRSLQSLGKNVPEDISIVSFDNSALSQMTQPGLTSVAHPGTELGKQAARSILEMISDPSLQVRYTFDPELVVRSSVKRLAGKLHGEV
ncbi:MAG: substrate-binding domain-containing protein, partial [Clostridiales bacterium]|nr:substrate-binding domain-containing protein [Clostridiales bacterium]